MRGDRTKLAETICNGFGRGPAARLLAIRVLSRPVAPNRYRFASLFAFGDPTNLLERFSYAYGPKRPQG